MILVGLVNILLLVNGIQHPSHYQRPISWCMDCATPLLFVCDCHAGMRMINRHHCPDPIIKSSRMVNV